MHGSQIFSFGLAPFSIAGVVMAVRGKRRGWWGWLLAALTQVAWIAYAVFVGPWPLGIGSVAWAVVYVWAFRRQRRDEHLGLVSVMLPTREVQFVLDALDGARLRCMGVDPEFETVLYDLSVKLRGQLSGPR